MYRGLIIQSFIILLILFHALLLASCQKQIIEVDVVQVEPFKLQKSWLDSLCSRTFAGRKVGTEGNKLAAQYIEDEVRSMGYSPVLQRFEHKTGDRLTNILVEIEGTKDSLIIIGAHFDGQHESTESLHYPAANDNASGVVTILSILDSLSRRESSVKLPYTIICAFWDGEEACVSPAFKGSSYFVSTFERLKETVIYANIDSIGHNHENRLFIGYYGNERVELLVKSIKEKWNFNYETKHREKGEGASDYYSFSKVGISNISFSDPVFSCKNPIHSTLDNSSAISFERIDAIKDIALSICLNY